MTAWIVGAPESDLGRMDVVVQDDRVELLIDVPGVAPGDLDVTVDGDELTVRGTRERRGDAASRTDRFERRVRLPGDLSADVAARLDNGVLAITVPRVTRRTRIPVGTRASAGHRLGGRVRRPWAPLREHHRPELPRSLRALADRARQLRR